MPVAEMNEDISVLCSAQAHFHHEQHLQLQIDWPAATLDPAPEPSEPHTDNPNGLDLMSSGSRTGKLEAHASMVGEAKAQQQALIS